MEISRIPFCEIAVKTRHKLKEKLGLSKSEEERK
jgi:hypothetical protein